MLLLLVGWGGGGSLPLLCNVDLPVPSPPGLGGSKHTEHNNRINSSLTSKTGLIQL